MKRKHILSVSILAAALLLSMTAFAGPKVAIVKSDNHKLVGESYKLDINIIQPYDFSKPISETQYVHPEWTKESEEAIEKMVRKSIELAGDWPVKKGNTVFMKPNYVVDAWNRLTANKAKPEEIQSCVTDPRVIRGVALVALESGAGKVLIGELPAHGDSYATAKIYGCELVVKELAKEYPGKVELLDLKSVPFAYYKAEKTGGLALKEYAIPKILMEADVVISVPKMKTHMMAGITVSLKNIGIGAPTSTVYGQPKFGLPHQRLAEVIVDVCKIVGIDYTVVDAIWAMEGNGPMDGSPIAMDMVVAGKDPVAVDWVCTECMGFKGEMFGITRLAQKYGLGTYQNVEVVGVPIAQVMKHFEPVPRALRLPTVYSHNVGWGPDAVAK
jgi:uncharacterized protein (DUF362 family)